ncbi:MAG: glycoside hydrolase family 2 protein [Saprospiraceae bacterium]
MRHLFCFAFLLFTMTGCQDDQTETISKVSPSAVLQALNTDWEFRQADAEDWMTISKIPSTVHTALLENKKIEDPFYRNNEADLQWIENKNWEYRKRFDVQPDVLKEEVVELDFKGLDTYAEVFLNGQKILEANNMFRSWTVDVKALLKPANNELRILFKNPITIENEKWAVLGYELPDGSRRTLTRKAAFHYGWDWGPRFVTMGPWKPIELRGWSKAIINTVNYRTLPIGLEATIEAFFDIDATVAGEAELMVAIDGKKITKTVTLEVGNNTDSLSFVLQKPKLWWPNGLGEQPLYDITGSVTAPDFSDRKDDRIGIRRIQLIQEESSDGLSFTFHVNSRRFFSKGANYIPQDVFQDRVKEEDYKKLLSNAKAANMNMLRVWGGGIYENDEFYETCDELGLLVWQDFMFANAMVPGDETFQQNVAAEAEEQIKRLANHPCIALWCGNNEISEGWHRWGWQNNLKEDQKDKIWGDYKTVFNNILPQAVDNFNPNVPYWETSPRYGRGDANHVYVGDSHYWGIWHDAEPFDNFKEKVPRFMSEFGFQSLPSMKTIESFTLPEDRNIDSEVMNAHQKHSRGTALIKEYMARHYKTPKDFESFTYVSQLLQAKGIRTGIEAHLRRIPYCMGSLYWQFNDCWPVASWSSIDNRGTWKALHYTARKAFEPLHVAIDVTDNRLLPMINNTTKEKKTVLAQIMVQDFRGDVKFERIFPVTVSPTSTKILPGATAEQVTKNANFNEVVIGVNLLNMDSSRIIENHVFLVPPKDLNLTQPKLKTAVTKSSKGYTIKLETDVLAKSVYLSTTTDGWFSENFFDMMAGEVKEIEFIPNQEEEINLANDLRIKTLVDTY